MSFLYSIASLGNENSGLLRSSLLKTWGRERSLACESL
jgi:hypothetical protein